MKPWHILAWLMALSALWALVVGIVTWIRFIHEPLIWDGEY